jgi:hypothetical protein
VFMNVSLYTGEKYLIKMFYKIIFGLISLPNFFIIENRLNYIYSCIYNVTSGFQFNKFLFILLC